MAISVITNVQSLNAQRNLQKSGNALGKSLERLSSGLRINRAGDDAAGLAISEGLRAQVRGLNQAVRNANDGISLLSTAEGATNEATNILQRMRELSVQAASDTNSSTNRAAIQAEVDQLVQELDRIAGSTEFNGSKLLDGSFTTKKLQIGANAGQTLDVNLGSIESSALGQIAEITAPGPTTSTAITAGNLFVNGTDIGTVATDGVSTVEATSSALAVAKHINLSTGSTGVTAEALATVSTGAGAVTNGTLNDTNALAINGVQIGTDAAPVVFTANDPDSALRDAINAQTNLTGVTASLGTSNELVLTAADGRNIELDFTGTGATLTGQGGVDRNVHGAIRLESDDPFTVSGAGVANAGFAGTVTQGLVANTAINTVDLTSQTGATTAIDRIDDALRQINSDRAGIGALTNRLESTISSLQSTSENLSASESRIRDADFAAETAALTRNQILQQAGISILAQSNGLPQLALSLLG